MSIEGRGDVAETEAGHQDGGRVSDDGPVICKSGYCGSAHCWRGLGMRRGTATIGIARAKAAELDLEGHMKWAAAMP